jgi:hypothetical protein
MSTSWLLDGTALLLSTVAMAIVGLLGLLLRYRSKAWKCALLILFLVASGLWAFEWSVRDEVVSSRWALLVQVVASACFLFGQYPGLHRVLGHLLQLTTRPRVQGALLLIAGPAFLVHGLARIDPGENPDVDGDISRALFVGYLKPVTGTPIYTDRGRSITPYQCDKEEVPELTDRETALLQKWRESFSLIRSGPPDVHANCHGWTFAGGRYWLMRADVEVILEDNGYVPVAIPQAGDVVVYRAGGTIVHTGVVRTVTPADLVLVEGKWSWMGTFLHTPLAQCYSGDFTYHRSPRKGHLLHGVESTDQRVMAK